MDRYLPRFPSKSLVGKVRRALSQYGIKPQERLWRLAWDWAAECMFRKSFFLKTKRWPSANEIATQYLFVLVAEMRAKRDLRLPYHAGPCLTEPIREIVSGVESGLLSLPAADKESLKIVGPKFALPMPETESTSVRFLNFKES
jgi:hypothetical protein